MSRISFKDELDRRRHGADDEFRHRRGREEFQRPRRRQPGRQFLGRGKHHDAPARRAGRGMGRHQHDGPRAAERGDAAAIFGKAGRHGTVRPDARRRLRDRDARRQGPRGGRDIHRPGRGRRRPHPGRRRHKGNDDACDGRRGKSARCRSARVSEKDIRAARHGQGRDIGTGSTGVGISARFRCDLDERRPFDPGRQTGSSESRRFGLCSAGRTHRHHGPGRVGRIGDEARSAHDETRRIYLRPRRS